MEQNSITVKELIDILKTFDESMEVYTEDCEGPYPIYERYIRVDEHAVPNKTLIISQWDSHGNR